MKSWWREIYQDRALMVLVGMVGLFAVAMAIYSNSFTASLHLDDIPKLRDGLASTGVVEMIEGFRLKQKRWFGDLTFAINYEIHGLEVFGYHWVNLLIHVLAGVMVWWVTVALLETPKLEKTRLAQNKSLAGWLTALLFVAHPLQTQAVTYIVQRYEALATLFYLIGIFGYLKGRVVASWQRVGWWGLVAVVLVLGLYTKEIVATLPVMLMLVEWWLFPRLKDKQKMMWLGVGLLVIVVVLGYGLAGRGRVFRGGMESTLNETMTWPRYVVTQVWVGVKYAQLLVVPVGQNVDHYVPVMKGIGDGRLWAGLGFHLVVGLVGYKCFRKYRFLSLAIVWMYVTALVAALVPLPDVMFEHRMYLPMVGFCWLIVAGLVEGLKDYQWRSLIVVVLMMAVVWGGLTYRRNKVWQSELTLWQDAVAKAPLKARTHVNYAGQLQLALRNQEALEQYQIALEIDPDSAVAYSNLGIIYAQWHEWDKAEEHFLKSLTIKPNYEAVEKNLEVMRNKKAEVEAKE